jgi:hypothetical protein
MMIETQRIAIMRLIFKGVAALTFLFTKIFNAILSGSPCKFKETKADFEALKFAANLQAPSGGSLWASYFCMAPPSGGGRNWNRHVHLSQGRHRG